MLIILIFNTFIVKNLAAELNIYVALCSFDHNFVRYTFVFLIF